MKPANDAAISSAATGSATEKRSGEALQTARQKRPDLADRTARQPRASDGTFTPIHGAYSLAGSIADGELDRRRGDVRAFLDFRARLVRDLTGAPEERDVWPPADLSAQQQSLVAEAAFLEAVCDAVRRYALTRSVVRRGGRLLPVLAEHYVTWAEAKRRHLATLGLEKRQRARTPADWRPAGA